MLDGIVALLARRGLTPAQGFDEVAMIPEAGLTMDDMQLLQDKLEQPLIEQGESKDVHRWRNSEMQGLRALYLILKASDDTSAAKDRVGATKQQWVSALEKAAASGAIADGGRRGAGRLAGGYRCR